MPQRRSHAACLVRTALIVVALLLGSAACGSDGNGPSERSLAAQRSDEPDASAAPPVAPEVDPTDYCASQGSEPFTGQAADHWGADNVMQAYCDMVNFTLVESSWVESLMRKPADGRVREAIEFSFVKQWMTPGMQAAWDADVQQALAGDEEALSKVQAMTFHNLTGEGIELPDRPDLVTNQSFSPAETWTDNLGPDGADRLAIKFTVSADVRLVQGGKSVVLPMEKTVTYFLVPADQDEPPWLIDGFSGTFRTLEIHPQE